MKFQLVTLAVAAKVAAVAAVVPVADAVTAVGVVVTELTGYCELMIVDRDNAVVVGARLTTCDGAM